MITFAKSYLRFLLITVYSDYKVSSLDLLKSEYDTD